MAFVRAILYFLSSTTLLLVLTSAPARCEDDVTLPSLAALLQQQAATIQSLQARLASMESELQQEKGVNLQQDASITTLRRRLDARVFFTARVSGTITLGTNNPPVQFDRVITNIGSGYNPLTGVFTAPQPGVYVFYVQIMSHGLNSPFLHYAIEKTGTLLCENSSGDGNSFDKSSCLATAHLLQGETVFVRRTDGVLSIEGYWCFFSGFLASSDS